jgi:hypothetical protein
MIGSVYISLLKAPEDQKELREDETQEGSMLSVAKHARPQERVRMKGGGPETREKHRNTPGVPKEFISVTIQQLLLFPLHDREVKNEEKDAERPEKFLLAGGVMTPVAITLDIKHA